MWVRHKRRTDPHAGTWALVPNKLTGQNGIDGTSGFNNPFNAYTWSMTTWQGKLYVGTYDWTYLVSWLPAPTIQSLPKPAASVGAGADLFSFADTNSPAVLEDGAGIGNPASYGVRNMLPDGGRMFVGMANGMNLLTRAGNAQWRLGADRAGSQGRRNRTISQPVSEPQPKGAVSTVTDSGMSHV